MFYGKGKPGSVIEVSSAYGSGSVEVGEDGHWELKVYFETAPFGESFQRDRCCINGRNEALQLHQYRRRPLVTEDRNHRQ